MNLTEEQKEKLGILDERVDYYFKVENSVFDGMKKINEDGEEELVEVFDSIYEKMVFILLCRYCNNNKVAFPSVATIAKQAMAGVTKVKECIKSLEAKGYIKKVSRKKANSNENDTNLYAIKNIDVGRVATNVGRVATNVGRVATNGRSCGDHNKELIKNNNLKRTTTKEPEKSSSSSLEIYLKEKGYDSKTISNITRLNLTLERVKEVVEYADKINMGIGYIVDALKNNYEVQKKQVKKEPTGRRSSAVLGEKDLEYSMSSEEKEHKRLESEVYKIVKGSKLSQDFFKATLSLKTLKEFIEKHNLKVS